MASHRYYPFRITTRIIKYHLNFIQKNAINLFDGDDSAGEAIQKKRGLVIKEPIYKDDGLCAEKGVYLITFTGTLQYYIKNIDVDKLQKDFYIVLEPSWAGYCLSEILWWSKLQEPVFIQATEKRDFEFLSTISDKLIPLSFGASDWVNPNTFFPIPSTPKIYDCVYVSNYNTIKRNFVFLNALRKINDPTYKAALICSGWGETREYNLALIKKYKLEGKLELIESVNQKELNIILNKAKVNILLSLKEGSNRSIFEGFFAGTPGIILSNNIGVNKNYFTKQSGMTIQENQLVKTLIYFKHNSDKYNPNKWGTDNISIFKTKEKLDNILKEHAKKQSLNWTVGTHLKINAPEAELFEHKEKLIDNADILEKYLKKMI